MLVGGTMTYFETQTCAIFMVFRRDGAILQESHGDGKYPVGAGMGTGLKNIFARGQDDPIPMNAQL